MPTHGYGPFRRFLMGSVTAKVLHDATCPVLTGVHIENAPIPETVHFKAIACAVDLGEHTREVLGWASGMAVACDADLVIVHVVTAGDSAQRTLASDIAGEEIARYQHDLQIAATVQIAFGEVVQEACRAAEQANADLLVIGRGHGPTAAGRLPSKTYAIVRTSQCPVVSV
jgi:nucleotide-binding universal stress UspA family protein